MVRVHAPEPLPRSFARLRPQLRHPLLFEADVDCRLSVMPSTLRHPYFLLLVTFCALWAAARIGLVFRKKHHGPDDEDTEDFTFIVGATLTLLGLIIGFTFSMAVSRYDQRKNFEEQEANAIGTEYVRVDALPTADAANIRLLLKSYLDERIQYYDARDEESIAQLSAETMNI